ncbi:MAG: SGNH/GDSL hydrolase family protein [Eubacteriales bacterium]|jgi:hypothetical protein
MQDSNNKPETMQKRGKEIGRKIGRTVLFFLILCLIVEGISQVISHDSRYRKGEIGGRNAVYVRLASETADTIQVINIGDSESYTTYSPIQAWEEAGITSYDCGQPGQRLPETMSILKAVFKRQKPEIVLLEAHDAFTKETMVDDMELRFTELIGQLFPVVRYHSFWNSDTYEGATVSTYKGFGIRTAIHPYDGRNYMARTMKKVTISSFAMQNLAEIRDYCEKHGAKLVLYSAPSPKNYNQKRVDALTEAAEELDVDYVDLNSIADEIGIDWSVDSLDDGDHLNLSGAEKTTRYLTEYLVDTFGISGLKNNPAQASWEKDAAAYDAEVDGLIEKIRGTV